MNTRKNYSRLLLALLLLVAGLAGAMRPHSVAAQNSGTTGPLNWNYDPGTKTLSITGSGDMPDFAIFMNQPWGAFRDEIETVTIGAGVTSVGKNAFLGCTTLTAVTLPSSVTTIGAFAFVSCKALTGITIPSGVKTIKESVFFGCTALTSVTLPEGLQTIGASAFLGCSLTNVTLPNSVTTMGEAAFHNCVSLTNVTLSDKLTTIGKSAFNGCSQLKNVTLPNSVTTMGESAFSSCTALTNVTLSDKLTTIEERAFKGCSQLKNVTIPNSVTTIGNGAFAQCTALKEVNVFWDTPLTISADAFQGIELNKVKLYVPAGKKGAYQAADVWKGFDVQEIPGGNLSGGLHWQYIPSTKTLSITGSGKMPDFNGINQPWNAFRTQIETVTIGAGVTSVGEMAFIGCRALKSVTLSAGLQTIKENAFLGCTALKSVTLPAGLQTLGVAAFSGCDALTRIELPASLETIGTNALDAPGLTEIKVQTSNTHFEAAEGVLYNKGQTTLLRYPRKKPGATFAVPASVTTIEVYAFNKCAALESITLPDALETIGYDAFNECTALKSITIPKKVGTIGDFAFRRSTGLKDVTVFWNTPLTLPPGVFAGITPPTSVTLHVPGGTGEAYQGKDVWKELTIEELPWGDFDNGLHWEYDAATRTLTITGTGDMPDFADTDAQPWKDVRNEIEKVKIGAGVNHVGKYAFTNCAKLATVTLPEGLETIGNYAFGECAALASISIPNSVTAIADGAFTECTALKSVTLPNSLTTIGKYAFSDCSALTSITLPEGIQTIGVAAFYNCAALASISIPNSVTAIADGVFASCKALASITIPNSVTAIADGVFAGCKALTTVTLPDGLQTIGKNAFQDCAALASISIPKSVTTIGSEAFSKCSALKSITLPKSVTTIGEVAFSSCTALTSITLSDSLTEIQIGAFNQCTALKNLTLPKKLTTIKDDAFRLCTGLTDVNVDWKDIASIPTPSDIAFRGVTLGNVKLHVPHGTVAAYQSKDVWKEFTIVELPLPPTPTPTPTPPTPSTPSTPSAPFTPPATGKKIGGLTLSATNFTLNGERTFRFTITITPADAADKRLSVSSSDETVVRVRILPTEETRRGLRAAPDPAVVTIEGTVCGLGKAKIHVKSTDGSNLTATCHVDVRALPTANIEAPATRIYTAAGRLHLTLPAATAVNVYNLTGTLVRTFIAPAGTSSIGLSQGVYVVRAGTHTEKVFVD